MFNALRDRLIYMHQLQGITRKVLRKMLHHDPSLTQFFSLSASQLCQMLQIPHKLADKLYSSIHNEKQILRLKRDKLHYSIVTVVDECYPPMLKTIKDKPLVLYALGNLSLLQRQPALSVIGTRNPSHEAARKISYILKPMIEKQWIVISGMAKGIDSFAHQMTLANGGKTIAVLGGGFHHIYPKRNIQLFQQIVATGLVLSEYPPDVQPKPYHFPERNRIISGLSFGTLVIEAMEKSGTLITVEQALDQGRDVYAVPGSPLLKQTKGCHKMIQEGAKLVFCPEDIMEDWEGSWKRLITDGCSILLGRQS